jgi:hypothetical protein
VRTALKLAIVLVATAAMAWCGLFVYWHLKIGRAIQELRHGLPVSRTTLRAAGCRSLPYLVAASTPSQSVTFLTDASHLIGSHLVERLAQSPPEGLAIVRDHGQVVSMRIEPLDTLEVRTAKCRDLQAWWRSEGSKYHQGWRIWSRRCR